MDTFISYLQGWMNMLTLQDLLRSLIISSEQLHLWHVPVGGALIQQWFLHHPIRQPHTILERCYTKLSSTIHQNFLNYSSSSSLCEKSYIAWTMREQAELDGLVKCVHLCMFQLGGWRGGWRYGGVSPAGRINKPIQLNVAPALPNVPALLQQCRRQQHPLLIRWSFASEARSLVEGARWRWREVSEGGEYGVGRGW